MARTVNLGWRYRSAIAARAVAAVGGGYLLASAVAAFAGVHLQRLGLPRSEAVLSGTLLGFAVYAAAAMGCFHCRRVRHAWLGTLGPAALLAAAVLLPRWVAGS